MLCTTNVATTNPAPLARLLGNQETWMWISEFKPYGLILSVGLAQLIDADVCVFVVVFITSTSIITWSSSYFLSCLSFQFNAQNVCGWIYLLIQTSTSIHWRYRTSEWVSEWVIVLIFLPLFWATSTTLMLSPSLRLLVTVVVVLVVVGLLVLL